VSGRILQCENAVQRDDAARQAIAVLDEGGVVVFPTETVYGVGARVDRPDGLARLNRIKQRQADKPFSVHLGAVEQVDRYVDLDTRPLFQRLLGKLAPGPVTFVVQVDEPTIRRKLEAMGLDPSKPDLLYHEGTIGLRIVADPVGGALLAGVDGPVVASSANHAGQAPPHTARAAIRAIGDEVDLVLDGGQCRFGKPSSVIQIGDDGVKMLREGVVDQRYLAKLMDRTLLFVCSGNTCRSPMAEAIARKLLADRGAQARGIKVSSAGVFAGSGAPATPEAVEVLARRDIDLSGHRSRPLTVEMLQQADVILCMTQDHVQAIASVLPTAAAKAQRLDPGGDISDPIGGGAVTYQACAQQIADHVAARLDEMIGKS
jgi:protein-tyrosine phosphatase